MSAASTVQEPLRPPVGASISLPRPTASGKFLWRGTEKLYLRGITYGPFRPQQDGCEYGTPEAAAEDFASMAAAGINTVRVYTIPPQWLLDLAEQHGLMVFAGLPWEQHVTFLDDPQRVRSIEQRVREGMRSLGAHPALLGVTIGNEIPASIVRWHGRKRIQQFLQRLYNAAKDVDPDALVTYVNFPTTEYLELDFLDFSCFNVYLETQERQQAYLARLQNLAGQKPLVMAEVGLDSLRNGVDQQAATLKWQIRTAFAGGAAGAFVFAWTDEWHRGGNDIEDWDFGITTRARERKPAWHAVAEAYRDIPFAADAEWPRISVVVCTRNGIRTISDTLDHLGKLSYPNFETILISDGSTDQTAALARRYPGVRVIETPNHGLSAARNVGVHAARGEIVAYIDDDAYPDPHWLHYLAHAFRSSEHAAIGGPNLPPPDDGPLAECVARAPGGPMHVLLTDEIAEHIPGCNFAVRKSALESIGGFDPRYRAAGDDVDVCWKLQERGWTLGFHPGAVVWHHRRNSLRDYWRQQRGYGKAEALLEQKWPEKYNAAGHLNWVGRLYGPAALHGIGLASRVYHGMWNSAPFQSLYQPAAPVWQALAQMPEWYIVSLVLCGLSLLGFSWTPLFWFLPLAVFAVMLPLAQIVAAVSRIRFSRRGLPLLAGGLFIIQPLARLWGRLAHGLTPWRERSSPRTFEFRSFTRENWSESWRAAPEWIELLRSRLVSLGRPVSAGSGFDPWDLHIRGGLFGAARIRLAVEEHGSGKQMLRWHAWPRVSSTVWMAMAALAALAGSAAVHRGWFAAWLFSVGGVWLALRAVLECCSALGSARTATESALQDRGQSDLRLQSVPPPSVQRLRRREVG